MAITEACAPSHVDPHVGFRDVCDLGRIAISSKITQRPKRKSHSDRIENGEQINHFLRDDPADER
jgi:hypothetical protein